MSTGVTPGTDRIEKQIVLAAPRARVWRALSDAREFGAWFGVDFGSARFAEGATIGGHLTYPGYEHLVMEIVIERIVPERLFSYRWHPHAVNPQVDYSQEPMTLVQFELQDVPGGTRLTVVESGFDRIPLARRAEAFQMNDQGWAAQVENVRKHVARGA